jgi:hypothetical protein
MPGIAGLRLAESVSGVSVRSFALMNPTGAPVHTPAPLRVIRPGVPKPPGITSLKYWVGEKVA